MAGRGGGGWRGGRSNYQYVRPVPFVLFPEIDLPERHEIDGYSKKLYKWDIRFNSYCKASAYYLEKKEELKGRKRMHVETYSDRKKKKFFTRDPLSQVLYFDGFAKELVSGKKMRWNPKKTRWNPEADMTQKAFFDELEKKLKKEEKGMKEEEESEESEDDDEVEEDKESEGDFNDGDYNQNDAFDDDEDDFNDPEPGCDEDTM
jgi:DNA-directed RNA polymerase III subunit RPC7